MQTKNEETMKYYTLEKLQKMMDRAAGSLFIIGARAICKDCLHFDVCLLGARVNGATGTCQNYKDKSEWVHMPCKVGDVVYQVTRNFISEFRVRFVEIATCGNLFLHTDLISGIVYTGEVFSESDIGKTVFLTREEGEKVLEEMKKK